MSARGRAGRVAGLILAAGLMAAGLQAQARPMPRPGMGPGVGPGQMDPEMQTWMQEMYGTMHSMWGVYAYGPYALLQKKADLALTADQVSSLEKLAAEVKTATQHAKAEHDVRSARIAGEFKLARPDPAKVKADGQEAVQDMAALHGVMLSAAARAKGLLTDAQRAKVDASITQRPGPGPRR